MRTGKLSHSPVRSDKEPAPLALVKGPSLEQRLAADLAQVFSADAPDVDIVALGLAIADLGRREAPEAPS